MNLVSSHRSLAVLYVFSWSHICLHHIIVAFGFRVSVLLWSQFRITHVAGASFLVSFFQDVWTVSIEYFEGLW